MEFKDLYDGGHPDEPQREAGLLLDVVEAVVNEVQAGRGVVVHCAGGTGRTGTVIACALAALGMAEDEVLAYMARVNAARETSYGWPESAWQESQVASFVAPPARGEHFTRLSDSPEDLAAVRAVLDHAPGYAVAVQGGAFGPEEAESVVRDLPPGASADDKRVFLVRSDGSAIGVVECIIGYPATGIAMLGLLVLDERWQGRGYGRQSVRWLEGHVREHERCTRVRLGVVASNADALAFWEAMGYQRTGEARPWTQGTVKSEVIAFEKAIDEDA